MVYVDNHIITLNSTDGTLLNGTFKSNINFAFTGLLKDDVNIIRTYITLLNAQIPVSFYVIDATNNMLKIYVLDPATGNVINQLSVSIPIGNYNSGTLITALNSAFVTAGINLTVSINPVNGILTFANSSSTVDYAIQSNNYGSTLALILGIGNTAVINSILIENNSSTILPFPLNLLGKSKLLINSTNLNNVAYTSFGLGFTTTIATVPVNVPPYSLIQYSTAVDQQKNILTNRVLDNIDIQILDTDNRFINFNNVDWSLTIVLSIEKIDANKFHIQSFNDYLGNEKQPIQPKEIVLNPPEQDKELEFLMN
jgi:hypothetical protein